jgi:hemolysin type calcium-binding protein
MRRRALIGILATAAVMCMTAAPAFADSKIRNSGGILYFTNEDAGIANRLTVDYDSRGRVHFYDEADPYGMQYPTPPCSPGKLNSAGNAVEVFCTKGSFQSITIQIGPNEDQVTYKIDDLPATIDGSVGTDTLTSAGSRDSLNGGQGNDTLDAGAGDDIVSGAEGNDTLRAGDGNDRVDGGAGSDRVDTGAGNDNVIAADGSPDTIDCGAGVDTVSADTTDQLSNCENVSRSQVAPPVGGSNGNDTARPVVQAGGSTRQRVSLRKRSVSVAVTVNERAQVDVSGYLAAGGINDRLKPIASTVKVGGGGTLVRVRLSRTQARRVLSDLRHHRKPRMRITISAADPAGNTSRPRHLTISLAR